MQNKIKGLLGLFLFYYGLVSLVALGNTNSSLRWFNPWQADKGTLLEQSEPETVKTVSLTERVARAPMAAKSFIERPEPKLKELKENKKMAWYYIGNTNHEPVSIPSHYAALLKDYSGLYQGTVGHKQVFLTFDEGYENGYTQQILDVLRGKAVPAAFFVTGSYLQKNPDLVKRMLAEGHLVCNHTLSHPSMPNLDRQQLQKEIEEPAQIYKALTGQAMAPFLRPPMGEFSPWTLQMTEWMGYYTVFWSFAYKDWDVEQQKGEQYAYQQVMTHVHPGAVLLLHAVSKDNAQALGAIIDGLRADGYGFATLSSLIPGPAGN